MTDAELEAADKTIRKLEAEIESLQIVATIKAKRYATRKAEIKRLRQKAEGLETENKRLLVQAENRDEEIKRLQRIIDASLEALNREAFVSASFLLSRAAHGARITGEKNAAEVESEVRDD